MHLLSKPSQLIVASSCGKEFCRLIIPLSGCLPLRLLLDTSVPTWLASTWGSSSRWAGTPSGCEVCSTPHRNWGTSMRSTRSWPTDPGWSPRSTSRWALEMTGKCLLKVCWLALHDTWAASGIMRAEKEHVLGWLFFIAVLSRAELHPSSPLKPVEYLRKKFFRVTLLGR